MNTRIFTWFGARAAVLLALLLGGPAAEAALLLELRGSVEDVSKAADASVRLSLLSLSDADQNQAVAQAFQDYQGSKNAAAFEKALLGQDTKGYIFTKEAAGYTVKYAWQDQNNADRLLVVVTPALKSRNPYLWKTPNAKPEPFTVLELRRDGDVFTAKSSLDSPVEVDAAGQLQLQNYAGAAPFATLRRTPDDAQTNPRN
ncbi:MAG: hypothetical protein LBF16_11945 [Pseudomonadales bacterium]|nr:hypothetical protein [Pseudomonadales bacterium]